MTGSKICIYQVRLRTETYMLEKWLISSRSGVFYVCEMQNPKFYWRLAFWSQGQSSSWGEGESDVLKK